MSNQRGSSKEDWTPERREAHKIKVREALSTPEYRAKLSASLKAKWKSGSRKPTPKSAYEKASSTMKKLWSEGKIKTRDKAAEKEYCSKGGKTVTEKQLEVARRNGLNRRGTPNPEGPTGKGEKNMFSKYWAFKSPAGVTIKGWNLNELVRRNAHLFNPEDTVWKGSRCKATHGLNALFGNRKTCNPTSWKGWVALPWIVAETVKQAVKDAP